MEQPRILALVFPLSKHAPGANLRRATRNSKPSRSLDCFGCCRSRLAPHLEVDVLPRIAHRDFLRFEISLFAHQIAQLDDAVVARIE